MATWTFTDDFAERQLNGNGIDLDTSTIKLAIATTAAAPTASSTTWTAFKAGAGAEVSGTGYTAGGNTIAIDAISAATNKATVSATSSTTSWTQNGAGFSNGKYFVLYDTASDYIIAFATYSGTLDLTSGDITVTFGTTGEIFDLTY